MNRAVQPAVHVWLALLLWGCGNPPGSVATGSPPDGTGPEDGSAPGQPPDSAPDSAEAIDVIAFGSCARQDRVQTIWPAIIEQDPDLFLFIGDNIYADTEDPAVMRAHYQSLAAQEGYQDMKAHAPILAVWDDHDYGRNDRGAEYPMREESQRQFLTFFEAPKDSPRWQREGIYDATILGPPGRRVQIILFDTRYHRGPLVRNPSPPPGIGPYMPTNDASVPFLGEAQWQWLEEELQKPAELRLLVSSVQVVANEHGWETWGNFPHERQRLYDLLAQTSGAVVLSGDRHLLEISRDNSAPYPLWDFTSSGLANDFPTGAAGNSYRIGEYFRELNFGVVRIDWSEADPIITLEGRSGVGDLLLRETLRLSSLRPQGMLSPASKPGTPAR